MTEPPATAIAKLIARAACGNEDDTQAVMILLEQIIAVTLAACVNEEYDDEAFGVLMRNAREGLRSLRLFNAEPVGHA